MAMTPEQKRLVQASFDVLLPVSQTAAESFYSRLFEVDPSLRSMFMGNMSEQARKFISMVRIIVTNMDLTDQVTPAVEALGRRHAGYGVEDRHYDTFGRVLIWAMEETLGPDFDADTREAWRALYDSLASSSRRAAAEVDAQQPAALHDHAVVAV